MVEQRGLARRGGVAGAARNDVDVAEMRCASAWLPINALTVGASVLLLLDVQRGVEGVALAVVSIDQPGALVNVRVTDEDEVDAALFEHREENLAHVVHAAAAVG